MFKHPLKTHFKKILLNVCLIFCLFVPISISSCSSESKNTLVVKNVKIDDITGWKNHTINITKDFSRDIYIEKTGQHVSPKDVSFQYWFSKPIDSIGGLKINDNGQIEGDPLNFGEIFNETISFSTEILGKKYTGETNSFNINIDDSIPKDLVIDHNVTNIRSSVNVDIKPTDDLSNSIFNNMGDHVDPATSNLTFQLWDDEKELDDQELKGLQIDSDTGIIHGQSTEAISLVAIFIKVQMQTNNGVIYGKSDPFNISIYETSDIVPPDALNIQNNELLGFTDQFDLTTLNQYSFLEIPNTVTSIGQQAFYNLSSISSETHLSVYFEDNSVCTSIENSAFKAVSWISEITFPNSLENIGDLAFEQLNLLSTEVAKINLSNCKNLKTIGNKAFSGSDVITVYLPNSHDLILGEQIFSRTLTGIICDSWDRETLDQIQNWNNNSFSLSSCAITGHFKANNCSVNVNDILSAFQTKYKTAFKMWGAFTNLSN